MCSRNVCQRSGTCSSERVVVIASLAMLTAEVAKVLLWEEMPVARTGWCMVEAHGRGRKRAADSRG